MTSTCPTPGPKFTSVIDFILTKYEVREPGTGAVPTVDSFLKDEELQRLLSNLFEEEKSTAKKSPAKKSPAKKASAKKTSVKKTSATPEERNKEKFDEDRCSARKWESDGGLGYDSIQCSSCKKIPADEAEKVMEEFKEKMDEDQLARLPKYLENYDGCFCKNHLKQDFFMPNGWWLGKVNVARPEKPMLPKGSFKDGYQEDYKEHHWMYGVDGQKVEKTSKKKKIIKKKKSVEKKEEPKKEEPKKKKVIKKKVIKKKIIKKKQKVEEKVEEEPKVEEEEVDDGTETEPMSSEEEELEEDEDDYEAEPYEFEGKQYMKIWDDDEKIWIITDPESGEMIGHPNDEGGIDRID